MSSDIPENKNLNRAGLFYKVNTRLFLFAILASILVRPLIANYPFLQDILIGFPLMTVLILSPLGLYFSIKSKSFNERSKRIKLKYLYTHLLFCLLITAFLFVLVSDVKQLLE